MDSNQEIQEQRSFIHKLFSTGLVVFSQVTQIIVSIIRTKFTAILLGVTGVGLLGIYFSIIETVRTFTNFGINTSAVKFVSTSAIGGNEYSLPNAYRILFRWSLFSGILGCLVVFLFAHRLSIISFGNTDYFWGLIIASISIIFLSIGQVFSTFLQGIREIKKLVLGAICSSFISCILILLLYFFLRQSAIPISFIITGLSLCVVYFLLIDKKYISHRDKITFIKTVKPGLGMMKLGGFLVLNSLVALLSMYFIKIYINNNYGLENVGIYQAVYAITNSYLGILLNAMLTEYYPHLCRVIDEKKDLNKEINQQAFITLNLGNTCVIILLIFSEFVLSILYSKEFIAGNDMLMLYLVGASINYIGWTLGVIFLATNDGLLTSISTIIPNIFSFLFIIFLFPRLHLVSCGIAYIIQVITGTVFTVIILKKRFCFKFDKNNISIIIFYSSIIFLYLFLYFYLFKDSHKIIYFILIKIALIAGTCLFCIFQMSKKVDIKYYLNKYFLAKENN